MRRGEFGRSHPSRNDRTQYGEFGRMHLSAKPVPRR